MKTNAVFSMLGLLVVRLVTSAAQANPPYGPPARYVEGELLVKFAGGPRGAAAEQARERMGHEVRRHFDFIGWQLIRLPRGMTVEQGLARYRDLAGVLAVEPNGVLRSFEPVGAPTENRFVPAGSPPVPNDPMFSQQYALAKIGATKAWAITTGDTNVIVAVLSTGVNYNHEDLRANMWHNPEEIPANGIDDDGNGHVDDVYGIDTSDDDSGNDTDPMDEGIYYQGFGLIYHGTINAGIIGAVGNNGRGIVGVNWSARLMALRAFGTDVFHVSDIIEALDYIVLMKDHGVNIRVVLLAYYAYPFQISQAMREAHERVAAFGILQVAVVEPRVVDHDISPIYPAAFRLPGMISVAATDQSDNLCCGFGRTSIDLAAPGIGIVAPSGGSTNAYYTYPGTDAAGAHVAGAAALLFSVVPQATAEEVKSALVETVDELSSLENKVASNGRLNVGKAMFHPKIVSKALRLTALKHLDDGSVRLAIEAPVPVELVLEASVDLQTWTPLATLMFDRQTAFTDNEARLHSQRFYRAKLFGP